MPEHRIRLRGGWNSYYREGDLDDGLEVIRRIDLPITSPNDLPSRIKLTRQFGKPPVDLKTEVVSLEMRNIQGMTSVRLNGHDLIGDQPNDGSWSAILSEPLLPRNGLVIEVVFDKSPGSVAFQGEIFLLIRTQSES